LKHDNIYLVGDAGGFGDIFCGLIYAAAKTGKMAAEDICGIDIKKNTENSQHGTGSLSLLEM